MHLADPDPQNLIRTPLVRTLVQQELEREVLWDSVEICPIRICAKGRKALWKALYKPKTVDSGDFLGFQGVF
jgi:hypothetical protein